MYSLLPAQPTNQKKIKLVMSQKQTEINCPDNYYVEKTKSKVIIIYIVKQKTDSQASEMKKPKFIFKIYVKCIKTEK